jgi:hypothetical protein
VLRKKILGGVKIFFLLQICENLEGFQKISKKIFFKNAIFSKNLDFQNFRWGRVAFNRNFIRGGDNLSPRMNLT